MCGFKSRLNLSLICCRNQWYQLGYGLDEMEGEMEQVTFQSLEKDSFHINSSFFKLKYSWFTILCFKYSAKWFSSTYFSDFFPIEYSSPCYTVNPVVYFIYSDVYHIFVFLSSFTQCENLPSLSMLLQMAIFHSFLWLNNIPLYLQNLYPFICW